MTILDAKKLKFKDRVIWNYEDYSKDESEPGTVTAADKNGVHIFWQYGSEIPTLYEFCDDSSWPNIQSYTATVQSTSTTISKNGFKKQMEKTP